MEDEKKPTEEEQKPEEIKQDEPKPPEEKPEEPEAEEKPDENEPESEPEKEAEEQAEEVAEQTAPPELSETDQLKEENFRLKTQIEAMKIGFSPDVIEDAVIIAENIAKRDGSDISSALQAVAKKYPYWKTNEKGKPKGFKIGADSSEQKTNSEEKLNRAFGIKK